MDIPEDFDLARHQAVAQYLRHHGPTSLEWLAQHVRRTCRDARINAESIAQTVTTSAIIVGLPDGRACHLLDVLRGSVFTHRVRAPLDGRTDLWANLALQPLLSILLDAPIPLVQGGEVRLAAHGHDAIVGPPGWLPPAGTGDLVGLRVEDDGLRVDTLDPDGLPDLEDEQQVRALLAERYRTERWWSGHDDLESRPAELTRAIGHAVLEVPELFATPQRPLNELLYDALQQDRVDHHRREAGRPSCRGGRTRSRSGRHQARRSLPGTTCSSTHRRSAVRW